MVPYGLEVQCDVIGNCVLFRLSVGYFVFAQFLVAGCVIGIGSITV